MTIKFQTTHQIIKFLRSHGVEFRGIYGHTYTLTDGRVVKFTDRSTGNTWGRYNEATEMVEAA